MSSSITQHLLEIEKNRAIWKNKELLHLVYDDLYKKLIQRLNPSDVQVIVELGSGIGNLKSFLNNAITSDIFAHDWVDLACSAYDLPFRDNSVHYLVLFDVFHHLQFPVAFFKEVERVLDNEGKLLLVEPYISIASFPIYGLAHSEPVAMTKPISKSEIRPTTNLYYAAQGNATRIFFDRHFQRIPNTLEVSYREAFSSFAYLLSGGFSKRSIYPTKWLPILKRIDQRLSRWPKLFGGRCIVEIRRTSGKK